MTAPRCPTCFALLGQALALSKRALALDNQVHHARTIGKGCATPALAIVNLYDRDLATWQRETARHLDQHRSQP